MRHLQLLFVALAALLAVTIAEQQNAKLTPASSSAVEAILTNMETSLKADVEKAKTAVTTAATKITNADTARAAAQKAFDAATTEQNRLKGVEAQATGDLNAVRADCDKSNAAAMKELELVTFMSVKLKELQNVKVADLQNDLQVMTSGQLDGGNSADLKGLAQTLLDVKMGRDSAEASQIETLLNNLAQKLKDSIQSCETRVKTATANLATAQSQLSSANAAAATKKTALDAAVRALDDARAEKTAAEKAQLSAESVYSQEVASAARVRDALAGKTCPACPTCPSCPACPTAAPTPAPTAAPVPATPAPISVSVFDRMSLQGQMIAEAACTAINPGGWTFAVRRSCTASGPTCAAVCGAIRESQAGLLRCVNSLHVYENTPADNVNKVGLKVHKYNDNGSSGGCGPNYCCCTQASGTAAIQEDAVVSTEDSEAAVDDDGEDETASLVALELEEDAEDEEDLVEDDVSEDLDEEDEDDEDDDEEEDDDVEISGVRTSGYDITAVEGQIVAQATCVALNDAGAWTYAVRRDCGAQYASCDKVCGGLTESQGGRLSSFNALHLYADNKEAKADGAVGLKTYRYNSAAAGGCGPNYCCCRATGSTSALETSVSKAVEENIDEESTEVFNRYDLDGQIEAEAVGVALAPKDKSGWTYAVRRNCVADSKQTCDDICGASTESQAAGSGTPHMYCLNSLHIYDNQPHSAVSAVGLKTYRYNSCQASGCGPNYCLCWAGYNNVKP